MIISQLTWSDMSSHSNRNSYCTKFATVGKHGSEKLFLKTYNSVNQYRKLVSSSSPKFFFLVNDFRDSHEKHMVCALKRK